MSAGKFMNLAAAWQDFSKSVEILDEDTEYARKIFYAGALSTMLVEANIIHHYGNSKAANVLLKALHKEPKAVLA